MKTKLLITSMGLMVVTAYAQPSIPAGVSPPVNRPEVNRQVAPSTPQAAIPRPMQANQVSSSVGAVPVTPQMMNKLEDATQKAQSAQQEYAKKVNEVKRAIESQGYVVTTVVERGGGPKSHAGSYYIVGPDGGYVEVSTSTKDDVVGSTVTKTIEIYKPGQSNGEGVVIELAHPDAKVAILAESDVTLSTESVKAGLKVISREQENIVRVITPPITQ
jgi:hypothetical protein